MQGNKRVSVQQLDILYEFLNKNRNIATSHNRSLQAKEFSKSKWREIAEILNSQGDGAHKDWRGWSKYWIDYKGKIKAKIRNGKNTCRQTGEPSIKGLSEVETKFLPILGEDFGQGLPGIQIDNIEPPVLDVKNDSPISELILDNTEITNNSSPIPPALSPSGSLSSEGVTPSTSSRVEHPADPSIPRYPRRRRYRRREPPKGPENARRALVRSSQRRADATVRIAEAMEEIVDSIKNFQNVAERIERFLYAAFPITKQRRVANPSSSKAV